MLGQGSQRKHESNGIHGREANAHVASNTDWVHSAVAFGGVDEASIGEKQNGLVWLIRQIAVRVIGQCTIAVVRIVPVFECGRVEVDASKDGIRAIVTARE
jgi:hypothetical protein